MITALSLIAIFALIAACGVFVAAEFAFVTVNRNEIDQLAKRGDRKARGVKQALKTLSTQLSGAQVGITITNLAIGFLAESTVASLIEKPLRVVHMPHMIVPAIAVFLGVVIATILTMLFGELVPKNIAIVKPVEVARAVQGAQRTFSRVMWAAIRVLNGSANIVLGLFGVQPLEELASARSADELSSLVRRSAEKGTLSPEMAQMLERSLTFGEMSAIEVMTPRPRMKTVRVSDSVSKVIELARITGLSRFPVIRKNLDDIVGIVHVKQAIAVPEKEREKTTVRAVMHEPIVVPSSIELDPLLEHLRGGGLQMAVVIDEFGGTDGIVTIEDLLEELVGEVHDEHDRARASIRKQQDGSWSLSGLLRPDEVGEELGIFLPDEEEFETLGGLVADRLERVPDVGDYAQLTAHDESGVKTTVRLNVERMDGRRVDRIRMELIDENKQQAEVAR